MYSMVMIVNNTVLYAWKLLREYISNVLTTKKNGNYVMCYRQMVIMMKVLAKATVVIICNI